MQFQFISDKSIGNFNLHRRSLSIFYDFFGSRPACKISTPSHTHAKCQDMPNFFLDLGIGYPTFNIYFFFGTQQAKIQKIAENRKKYSRSGSYIEPASNILATWVNFTISATWDNFTISATWVTFTISATSSHSGYML